MLCGHNLCRDPQSVVVGGCGGAALPSADVVQARGAEESAHDAGVQVFN